MPSDRESQAAVVKFFDNFLDEKNIKWMLSIGVFILLGSSLRLVATHWGEYTSFWKYGILLCYTAAIFVSSQISYFRLSLRRTGTVLMVLTLMLIPVTFHALHWVRATEPMRWSDFGQHAGLVGLLGLNIVLSTLASHRVLVHFLRKPQLTLLICYMILCVAGAVIPGLPRSWGPSAIALLWLVFTAGTLKANRHVFWLAEDGETPRIFGFFPILLLGGQFLGLFALQLAPLIDMQWWGLASALVALPVLSTSDTVARVYQQRTGNLVRPLPPSIIVPLVSGLLFCFAGICLSTVGFPRPYAIVPTAAICAFSFMLVANRTGYQAFTWCGIACVLAAYQFSPLFFLTVAKAAVQNCAVAVQESRLPYAFYGLTYLPVIVAFTAASVWTARREWQVFSIPLKNAAIALAVLMLAVAFGHPKAVFPVSIALFAVFSLQTYCFKKRGLLIPANLALLGMSWELPIFVTTMIGRKIPMDLNILFAIVGWIQFVAGNWLDPWSKKLAGQKEDQGNLVDICRMFSLVVVIGAAGAYIDGGFSHVGRAPSLAGGLLLATLLVAHALRAQNYWLGIVGVVFFNLTACMFLFTVHLHWEFVLLSVVIAMALQWAVSLALQNSPIADVTMALSVPLQDLVKMMHHVVVAMILFSLFVTHAHPLDHAAAMWVASGVSICLGYMIATRFRSSFVLAGSFLTLLMLSTAVVAESSEGALSDWYPLVWTLVALVALFVTRNLQSRFLRIEQCSSPCDEPLSLRWLVQGQEVIARRTLLAIAGGTLLLLAWPTRLAGGLAIVGLLLRRTDGTRSTTLPTCISLANWQVLSLLTGAVTGETRTVFHVTVPQYVLLAGPVALFGTIGGLLMELLKFHPRLAFDEKSHSDALWSHTFTLNLLTAAALLVPVFNFVPGLSAAHLPVLVAAFCLLSLREMIRAYRKQSAESVWMAEILGLLGVGYLGAFGLVDLTLDRVMFVLLAACLVFTAVGNLAAGKKKFSVFSGPLLSTAYWLPLAVAVAGVTHHLYSLHITWKGMNSLALFIASGIYFFHGFYKQRPQIWVLAVGILNVALILLWRELSWTDPQLFLIPIGASVLLLTELLQLEIPSRFHDPLRYAAALIILISPTFEIVSGSWVHLLSLMVLSVLMVLLSIGLRLRALVYTGTAFLIADLIAMVVRGTLDHPNLLWGVGIVLGSAVIGLAAYCEHHRESLISRIRLISAELESWR